MDRVNCEQLPSVALALISAVTKRWFVTDSLLFAAWSSHHVVATESIRTIRSGRGLIEYNPQFISKLHSNELREVMKLEALRILLKHPYGRRKPCSRLTWEASNLAIRECVPLMLPIPAAAERFGSASMSAKHFELYYEQLQMLSISMPHQMSGFRYSTLNVDDSADDHVETVGVGSENDNRSTLHETTTQNIDTLMGCANTQRVFSQMIPFEGSIQNRKEDLNDLLPGNGLEAYCNPLSVGHENCANWDFDALRVEQINDLITDIHASNNWGSICGGARERILATLCPKLDYRNVLKAFRTRVLSNQRSRTRMRPSRRYGFEHMGSRRDFSTRILFAIDVSGSVGTVEIRQALGIVNQFLKYGIDSIDVIWFDSQLRAEQPLSIKQAIRQIEIVGRGGTNFQPILDFLDDHQQYDGLIVFTDGVAPTPSRPLRNQRTHILWLFHSEELWKQYGQSLVWSGSSTAFIRSSAHVLEPA